MLCFRQGSVRCAHYRVCNANSSVAVELFARNGTQTEPRLRINAAYFKTLHFVGAGKSWKISSFGKTRHLRLNSLNVLARLKIKCEFAQSQTRLLTYTYSGHQYDNFQNGRFVQLSNFKEFISFASDFNSSSVRVRPFPIF